MRFSPQFLDELRARLPVSEVVGKRVKLKRAGREYKGLSPFQQEKSPSFTVNDQKGFYHDFSSGKHGDIFSFVMETEGVSFAEAVERLASLAGVPMPVMSADEGRRAEQRKSLYDVMELAAKFFAQTLASRAGAKARGYLADRALDAPAQVQFRLGYAPAERFALKEHLGGLGISVPDMIEAGLLIAGDDIPVPYDRFRDRVMFPITDGRGRVIAFGGRALEKDVPAKYLNSPETPLFHKGETLYNIAGARQASHEGAALVAVEGYVDVIAMVRAGFAGTVAPLGTALTESQLGLMWKMADEPILCFDGDKAGQRAAFRAADIALPLLRPGKSLRFALLPEGQDPDDLIRASGRAALDDVLTTARPLADMIWAREIEPGGFATPERRAALEARVSEIANTIRDEVVRKYYRQDLLTRLREMFAPPQRQGRDGGFGGRMNGHTGSHANSHGGSAHRAATFARSGMGGGFGAGRDAPGRNFGRAGATGRAGMAEAAAAMPIPPQIAGRGAMPRREALILQALLNHPWLIHDHLEAVTRLDLINRDSARLRDAIVAAVSHFPPTDDAQAERTRLRVRLENEGFSDILQRLGRIITTPSVWGVGAEAAPGDVILTWNQLVALHHQWNSLTKELKEAQSALGQDPSDANYQWLTDVKTRLEAMDGTEASIDGFGELSGRTARGV